MSVHPVAYLVKLLIELSLASLIVDISSAKPQRSGDLAGAFEGLKIAVSTHTTTTAVRVDDEEGGEYAPAIRTTRTPARPDDVFIEMGAREPSRRGSDPSLDGDADEKGDAVGDWQGSIHHLPSQRLPSSGREQHGVRFVVSNESLEKV